MPHDFTDDCIPLDDDHDEVTPMTMAELWQVDPDKARDLIAGDFAADYAWEIWMTILLGSCHKLSVATKMFDMLEAEAAKIERKV